MEESKRTSAKVLTYRDLGPGSAESFRLRGVPGGRAKVVIAKHKHRTMSMGDAVPTHRAQQKPDQLAASPLRHDEESCAARYRFQYVRRIALYHPAVDGEIRVVGALALYETVEHLLGAHIRIEIGGGRTRPS